YAAGTGSLTISQNATTPSNFSSATGTCCNTTLVAFTPLTYDSAYNTASPAGSSTTSNWGGCVIEPTSSGENVSGTGVLAVSGNPDTSEPTSGASWYPYYWAKDSANNWASGTVSRQDTTTELQEEGRRADDRWPRAMANYRQHDWARADCRWQDRYNQQYHDRRDQSRHAAGKRVHQYGRPGLCRLHDRAGQQRRHQYRAAEL